MANEVDDWFSSYEHPLAEVMLAVRRILLEADARMEECIKWKSPTFTYRGNLASFNPRTKAHVSLMFHTGAQIPGDHPRLLGGGDTARYMRFESLGDVEAAAGDLKRVVKAWIASRDEPNEPGSKKKASKKKASKKKASKKKASKKKASKKKASKKKASKKKASKKKASKKKATAKRAVRKK